MIYSIDFETSKAPHHLPWIPGSFVVCLSMVWDTGSKFWLFNHQTLEDTDETQAETLADCQKTFLQIPEGSPLLAHNLKFELHWLRQLQIDISHLNLYCTMVGEYIRHGQAKIGYSLHESCKRNQLTGKSDLVSRYWGAGYETDEVPVCVLRQYNENDCRQVLGLYRAHRGDERLFKGNGETTSLVKLQMLEVQALADIEQNGMVISEVRNERHITDTQATLTDLDARIRKITGRNLNIKSNDQRSALLFGGCYAMGARKWVQTPRGIKTSRDTLTKYYPGFGFSTVGVTAGKKTFTHDGKSWPVYNTDRDTINKLKCTTPEQKILLTLLQERATLEKQLNTYYEPIKERQINGTLHCNMNQTVTRTGRLSSSKPNLQNITRGSTSPVKECFITRY